MSGFMYCYRLLLLVGRNLGAFLQASDYAVDSIVEILFCDGFLIMSGCNKGSFVAYICNVGAGESGSLAGESLDIKGVVGANVAKVDVEYCHAVIQVGKVNIYLSVKAAGAHQSLVKNIGAVGGGEDYDSGVGAESIHLSEQLVESVLTLVVGAHVRITSASPSYGINLIDKYDARSLFFGLSEKIAYARCSYSDKHFYEIASRH